MRNVKVQEVTLAQQKRVYPAFLSCERSCIGVIHICKVAVIPVLECQAGGGVAIQPLGLPDVPAHEIERISAGFVEIPIIPKGDETPGAEDPNHGRGRKDQRGQGAGDHHLQHANAGTASGFLNSR